MSLQEHYKKLFMQYGDTPQAAQWADQKTQERRFQILTEVAPLQGASVLDVGCGTGHLATYIRDSGIKLRRYTGVDIVDEVLTCAKSKHPEWLFYNLQNVPEETYDYVLISGVFNNKVADNRAMYQSIIQRWFPKTGKAMAFNMLSRYVDYFEDDLFYEYPEEVFRFVKTTVSPYAVIRNDYQVKPGVIPFEFTVYVYRK